jgi:hypothetical protein
VSLLHRKTGKLNSAFAQEDWKTEFNAVCSKTQHAMNLSSEELKDLVARCDNLKPLIEKLDGPVKKIYLRKLKKCKDLFLWKGSL